MKNSKLIFFIPLLTLILSGFLSLPLSQNLALAQEQPKTITADTQKELDAQDVAFLKASGVQPRTIGRIVSEIIKAVIALIGVIFVILIIYAGFLWMTAAGNDEAIAKAKKIMTAALIGTIIILCAYAITIFVFDNLLFSTTGE